MINQRSFAGIIVLILIMHWFPGQAAAENNLSLKADSVSAKALPQTIPEITGISSDNRFRNNNTVLFGDHITFTVKNLQGFQ